MTLTRPLIASWLFAACVCWAPTSGSAQAAPAAPPSEAAAEPAPSGQGDESRDVASRHFGRAVELFQEGAYRAALIEFQRAYETLPDYRLHYNIGQTKLQLQDYVGAQQSYQRYLADGGDAVPDNRRREVTQQLELMRERIARLSITANEDSARIFIDDHLVGVTPMSEPVSVNVGRHRVVAKGKDGAEAVQVIDVAGGDLMQLRLPLEAPEPKSVVIQQASVEKPERSMARKFAMSGVIIGSALVAGAAIGAGMAVGAQNDFDSAVDDGSIGAARNHQSKAENAALATDVLGATGIALLAAGVITWFTADGEKKPEANAENASVRWGIGPGSVLVTGSF